MTALAGQGANRRMEKPQGGLFRETGTMCGLRPEQKISPRIQLTTAPHEDGGFLCTQILVETSTERPPMNTKIAIRVRNENPDHHLWNNHGTFWCHYTEHLPDYTKRRVRRSLRTADRAIARFLRDSVLFEAGAILCPRQEGGAA